MTYKMIFKKLLSDLMEEYTSPNGIYKVNRSIIYYIGVLRGMEDALLSYNKTPPDSDYEVLLDQIKEFIYSNMIEEYKDGRSKILSILSKIETQ